MIANNYYYGLIDLSYIISRNIFSVSKDKKPGEYNEGDVLTTTIWSLNKIARDYNICCDKLVMLADRWDPNMGGYFRNYLLRDVVQYKGSRKYMNEELLEELRNNPETTPEELAKAESELYQNQVKTKAKWAMIRDFKSIGIPVIMVPGWEADDLSWLFAGLAYGKTGGKKSVLITKDSDQMYSTTPELDFFKLPTNGSEPKVITYEEMYNSMPEEIKNWGVSLYNYNALQNALGVTHNDMGVSRKKHTDPTKVMLEVLKGDYHNIENRELFDKQLESYDISKFPRIEEACDLINNYLPGAGHYDSDLKNFHEFCKKYGITKVSDKYFSEFIGRFDQKLFTE